MRRRSVVAFAALIAVFALTGLPAPAQSTAPSVAREPAPAAFSTLTIPAQAQALDAQGPVDAVPSAPSHVGPDAAFAEPAGDAALPASRPKVDQPQAPSGADWKPPKYTMSGYATFYDHGTTAMRLPRGTVVRICGDGGCIERVVNDYGPQKEIRIVDLYRPDFFRICGCEWFAGTTWVTVSVY